MQNNLVDHIGSTVTVWTKDGNAMEDRTLLTVDSYGVVVTQWNNESRAVFVPWVHVNYIDYPAALRPTLAKVDTKDEVYYNVR
jgi:hypothetical protein